MIIHPSLTGLTHLYLLLTTLLHTAQASPSCTALYGFPSYSACDELLYGDDLSSGYTGIGYTDSKDHFFALPLTSRPPLITDEQWENKVNLPIIRSNLRCKLAVIPLLSSTGTITSDTSDYWDLASTGDSIKNACIAPNRLRPTGGHSLAGDNDRLLIILYARNSDFDQKVRRRLAHGDPILGDRATDGSILPGLGSYLDRDDAASSSSKPPSSANNRDTANSAPRAPTCGQACWGPSRPCDAADGCTCIADPWQGVGSAYFTGRCKVPYRKFSSSSSSSSSAASERELLSITDTDTTAASPPRPAAAADGLVLLTNTTTAGNNNDSSIITIQAGLAPDTACPCNCTYVSRACCYSTTGIVHEPPMLKLGTLRVDQEEEIANSSLVCSS